MTHTPPTPAALPQWDNERFEAFIRTLEPLTPDMRNNLLRVANAVTAIEAAYAQYRLTGDPAGLKVALPVLATARRDMLIAAGADPDSPDILPPIPVMTFN